MKYLQSVVSIVILSMAFTIHLNAQSWVPIAIGVGGGLNLAENITYPTILGKSTRTGFSLGASFEVSVREELSLVGEIMHWQGGYELDTSSANTTLKANYVGIFISPKCVFLSKESTVRPFVFAGGGIAFSTRFRYDVESPDTNYSLDWKDSTLSPDISAHFGAGIEINISDQFMLFFNGRYSFGLKDVYKPGGSWQEINTRNLPIMAGIVLKLK